MRFIILYLLIRFFNNYGNAVSEDHEESKKTSEQGIEKPQEINNHSDNYVPFSHVYVFKYDVNPLAEEQKNDDVSLNNDKNSEGGIHSDPALRYSSFVMVKQLSGRKKADIKYLENLMAHPTWFTVFTMERPKDFHLLQVKHPVLKNIEKIQQFYKKSLAEAMCMTSKGHQYAQEPYVSNSFPPKNWGYPYFRYNESNYDKTQHRENIRKKIQQNDGYRTRSNTNQWFNGYNRFSEPSCRSLCKPNPWIPQPSNITEERYKPQINDDPEMYTTERNVIGNNNHYNWSDFPENVPSFFDNPSGFGSNIKAIFGETNNILDVDYLPAHGVSEYVDHSEETI